MSETLKLVWLSDAVVQSVVTESLTHYPNETGGVLLGYVTDSEWVVTEATKAGPLAKHCRRSYLPDQRYDEERIAEQYASSKGVIRYLGDWHSHPDGALALSLRDRNTLTRIAKYKDAQISHPLMLLSSGAGDSWSLGVWMRNPKRRCWKKIVNLPVEQFSSEDLDL